MLVGKRRWFCDWMVAPSGGHMLVSKNEELIWIPVEGKVVRMIRGKLTGQATFDPTVGLPEPEPPLDEATIRSRLDPAMLSPIGSAPAGGFKDPEQDRLDREARKRAERFGNLGGVKWSGPSS